MTVQQSWHRFLATYEPLRAELYRYCRHLTRSPWDAEDLAQDTLARAFVTLAQMGSGPPNPRAWLFRVASNLWIDQMRAPARGARPARRHRRRRRTRRPRARPREAAGTLLVKLSPQERAAVVLKDVFDFSLEETAEALATDRRRDQGGAASRARQAGRRRAPTETDDGAGPGVLDAFFAAFNAGDLDRLTALLLDTAVVEVVGATTQYGPEAARRTVLTGMLFGVGAWPTADGTTGIDPRLTRACCRAAAGRGALAPRALGPGALVQAHRRRGRTRLHDARARRRSRRHLQNYFYNADFLVDLGGELGVPVRINGHRWWTGGVVVKARARARRADPRCAIGTRRRPRAPLRGSSTVCACTTRTPVSGRPLVLIHGGGSTVADQLRRGLPKLARAPSRDRGRGAGPRPHRGSRRGRSSFEQMADDTAALLEQLARPRCRRPRLLERRHGRARSSRCATRRWFTGWSSAPASTRAPV